MAAPMLRCLLFFLGMFFFGTNASDEFSEELFIKPLQKGYVYSHFQFTTKWNASIHHQETFQHYHLFPKALGEVLLHYDVQELHLSQTQGLWHHRQWGYPIHDAPPGAELWVWFKPSVKDIDKTWTDLANAVSGLFCSSLNFLDSKNTVTPRWSFRPQGLAHQGYAYRSYFMRYGTLPREIVCTENLTPWRKLLPCDSNAGLSTLFNAFHFHDANYHSLGLHVRPICADSACMEEAIELSQSLSVVTDVVSTSNTGAPHWSLKSLFGNHLVSACPIASKSVIMVQTANSQEPLPYRLTPEPTSVEEVIRGDQKHSFAVYQVPSFTHSGRVLNVAGTYNDVSGLQEDGTPPPIHAHRYITGYGLSDGGISCLIHSSLPVNQSIIYLDILPWFTRVYFSSLEVSNNGHKVPFKVHYVPAKDRSRPHHLELSFMLWPHSTTRVSFTFTRAFLKWTEYPPDANHGFYISSAVITALLPSSFGYTSPPQESSQLSSIFSENSTSYLIRIHTESLLVSLPTPDFSMPYNVICLACTVLAIAFGSMHNLTTRRFIKEEAKAKRGLLTKVKSFFTRQKDATLSEQADAAESADQNDIKEKSKEKLEASNDKPKEGDQS
ncbi:GPI transamidase component pig-t [Plakobranchus ocellatus]|uniref:GPI transamidase component pig-t n=1 Tax=Plakobranchus ocellatus TaxID=259542 RepID=A0AAV4DGS9_9GAST|nr:GPI transamidase component pig-t [Plakobranchus ocellatus]